MLAFTANASVRTPATKASAMTTTFNGAARMLVGKIEHAMKRGRWRVVKVDDSRCFSNSSASGMHGRHGERHMSRVGAII